MADSKKPAPYGTIVQKPEADKTVTEPTKRETDKAKPSMPAPTKHAESTKSRTVPSPSPSPSPRTTPTPHERHFADEAPHLIWGLARWDTSIQGVPTGKHPAFLDGKRQWWWATTANQAGVNPAVEKVVAPIEWEPIK